MERGDAHFGPQFIITLNWASLELSTGRRTSSKEAQPLCLFRPIAFFSFGWRNDLSSIYFSEAINESDQTTCQLAFSPSSTFINPFSVSPESYRRSVNLAVDQISWLPRALVCKFSRTPHDSGGVIDLIRLAPEPGSYPLVVQSVSGQSLKGSRMN